MDAHLEHRSIVPGEKATAVGEIPSSDAAFPHPLRHAGNQASASSEVLRNRPMQQLRRWRGESLRPSSRLPSEEA
jgi:hypothetical protein